MNIDLIKPTQSVFLADKARQMELEGRQVVKLQTGDPDFPTHPSIIDAAHKAMKGGHTHYSFVQGLPQLRKSIAGLMSLKTNAEIRQEQVIITHGAVQSILSIMAAYIEPGDEVLIIEPNWPTVESLVTLMGGIPVKINYFKDSDVVDVLNRAYSTNTKMICFNTPNNPTGIVIPQSTIENICQWAASKDIFVLADEVYNFLQFEDETTTSCHYLRKFAKYIFVDSFSKKFAMTGWRIGFTIADEAVIKKMTKASQLAITNVQPFVQYGAIEAMENELSLAYAEEMKCIYNQRRRVLIEYCHKHGLEFIYPKGAFYLFLKLPEDLDDSTFCDNLLTNRSVCLVPGSAFGMAGKGYVRISYANSLETVLRGLDLLRAELIQHT